MKKVFVIWLILGVSISAFAQAGSILRDSIKIYFRQGYSSIDSTFKSNPEVLSRITDSLSTPYRDSVHRISKIMIVGGASPEGSVALNKLLSEKRAKNLFRYFERYGEYADSLKTFVFIGRDWAGLIDLVKKDENVPYREATLRLLREILWTVQDSADSPAHLTRLQKFKNGIPYRYMYKHLFPELRASRVYLWYEKIPNPEIVYLRDTVYVRDTLLLESCCKPIYAAIKTNMLYDALAIPNIGIDVHLGKNWSLAAYWMYAWWKCDTRYRYWRIYGGDVEVRKWFGRKAKAKPLTGHHIGVYAQMLTYDFEWGGRGYLGDKWSYGGGISYGYSLPITARLNIDFGLSVGYIGGKYKEYLPTDNHYVWQVTKQRHWIGPTEAEISLVWLIGCDNYNRNKGRKK